MTFRADLPFTTRAAVIDRFAQLVDPENDVIACNAVIKALNSHSDLRRRFFSRRPSPGWVKVLWGAGFFDSPPSPVTNKLGTYLPSWDAQDYLVAVAKEVPEFVRKHVQQLKAEAVYHRRALEALIELPTAECDAVMPVVLSWFTDLPRATTLCWQAVPLMERFIKESRIDLAIQLFEKVTQPWLRAEAATMDKWSRYLFAIELPSALLRNKSERKIFYDLAKVASLEVISSIERNIRLSIDLVSEGPGDPGVYLGYSRRSAIEDEDEEDRYDVREQLPDALHDALLFGLERNQNEVGQVLERFLQEQLPIFRYIGLDFLLKHPGGFPNLVARELGKDSNLYDDSIHYEFFALMASSFELLTREAKANLVSRIRRGPPVEQVDRVAKYVSADAVNDLETYKGAFVRRWIRDGLWNLHGSLEPADQTYLDELVAREGEPDARPPRRSFTSSSWVREGSPLAEDQMTQLEPPDLVAFLSAWKPAESGPFLPHHDTYRGLANTLAAVIDAKPERYQAYFVSFLLIHPEYAATVLNHFRDEKRTKPVPWALLIPGMKVLLASLPTEGEAMTSENSPWVEVRRAVARLCLRGLENDLDQIPTDLLDSTKALLFELVNDPDPDPNLEEAWPNVDPLTASLNHVRPIALEGLIRLAHIQAQQKEKVDVSKSKGEERLRKFDADLADALGRRLDTSVDRSLAIRSVIGRYFAWLQWLDPRWTQDNIDAIFPAPATPEAAKRLLTAMGGFVIANKYCLDLVPLLDPAYRNTSALIRGGSDWGQSQVDPMSRFASHAVWMHLLSDREVTGGSGDWVLNTLYAAPNARVPIAIAEAIVGAVHDASTISRTWPRVRRLIENRVNASTLADHPSSYDEEMWELAQVFVQIKDLEPIGTLSPLLTVVALHVARSDYLNHGWESLLDYVETVAPKQPAEAMRLFQRMIESNENRHWYDHENRARHIFEKCASDPAARPIVCAVLDLLESRGITEYRALFEKVCS